MLRHLGPPSRGVCGTLGAVGSPVRPCLTGRIGHYLAAFAAAAAYFAMLAIPAIWP